mgnify:CR=1 FL=1
MAYTQQNITDSNDSTNFELNPTDFQDKISVLRDSINLGEIESTLHNSIGNLKDEFALKNHDSIIDNNYIDKYTGGIETLISKKENWLKDFSITAGVNISSFSILDSNFANIGIQKNYWVNISQTIYDLPLQLGFATGDGISYGDVDIKKPLQFNLNFNYEQYLSNIQSNLMEEYESSKGSLFNDFEEINFDDSLVQYNILKDTLSNIDYLVYINNLKNKKSELIDSINNCYEIDATRLNTIDSVITQYEKYRIAFNKMLTFQEFYYSIKAKYDAYLRKLESVKQDLGNATDLTGLLSSAENYGLSTEYPKWPLNFKKLQIGAQYINYTPLTLQNYVSNGINLDYNNDALIIKAAALTQNWYGGYGITNAADSLFNIFQNNQTAYLTGIGFGNPDSNHILFSTAYLKEDIQTTGNESTYFNFLISIYQKMRLVNNLILEYEIAKSGVKVQPELVEVIPETGSKFAAQSAIYIKLGYSFAKSKTEIAADQSFIGNSYINIGNAFVRPGTINTGLGLKQSFLKSKFLVSYKLTLSKTTVDILENVNTYYHLAQMDYTLNKIASVHMMISPYQYNYSIEDITNSENSASGNFINCYAVFNIPFKKSSVTSIISYSNFSTQNNFSDTLVYLKTNSISSNTIATIKGRTCSLNTTHYIPQKEYAYAFINSIDLKANILNEKNIYLDFGPKWLGYKTYNDQLGGSVAVNSHFGKAFNLSIMLDKYFEIEHDQEKFYSSVFFNASFSVTLNHQ